MAKIGRARGRRYATHLVSTARAAAALALGLCFVCGHTALAQSDTDGGISGRVLGPAGQPLSNVRVVAHNIDTGLAIDARTGLHGEFLIVRLPVGEYNLSILRRGTEEKLPDPISVGVGQVTQIDATLQPTGQATAPDAANAVGSDLRAAQAAALPVNGGAWRTLALTAAGADPAAGEDDSSAVSFRGLATTQNNTRTDGTSTDNSFTGSRVGAAVAEEIESGADTIYDPAAGVGSGPRSVTDGGRRSGSSYAFSQAGVREFRVQGQADAAAYGSALYGHGVGGVLTTVSRSGGAVLHGMAFYTVRNSAWSAVNPFSLASTYRDGAITNTLVKPQDLRQQFGGSIGGPMALLKHDSSARSYAEQSHRLFFFYAFDAQRRNFPALSSPGYAGFYSLTATQKALLANRGVTQAKTNAALNYLDSLTGTVPRQADQTVNFGRIDWHRQSGTRVTAEYNRTRWSSPGGARSSAVVNRGVASLGSAYGAVDSGVTRWAQFLRHGFSNEVRVQYGRELQYEVPQTPLQQEPNVGPGGLPPEIAIAPDGLVFGTPAALGKKAYPEERRFEVADDLLWIHGRHLVQVGGDFSALNDRINSLANTEGTFTYDSGATGGRAGGLVDWITDFTFNVNAYPNGGCPSINAPVHDFCFRSYSQSFGQQSVSFATQEWAGFVQDDWRVAQRLTLHAGLRYEYEFLPLPQKPNAALDAEFGAVGATSIFPEDRNNFGPRLGLEWSPFGAGRGLIRAGYGLYLGKLPGATIRAALLDTAMASSVTRVRILPTTETVCPQMTTVGFGYACSFLSPPAGVVAATTSAMVFDRKFRLPMVQQGTLSVEHTIGGGVVAFAQYVVNLDRQLPDSVDINIAPSTATKQFQLQGGTGAIGVQDGEMFSLPIYTSRISASFGPVTDIVSDANASYNGLTLEARRHLGSRSGRSDALRDLDFRVAWTWSKAIDFGPTPGAVPRTNGRFDPFNVRYDKGLSALNFPHRTVATVVWTPRFGASGAAASATAEPVFLRLVNGWSVGAIFAESSGRGYSYDVFGGARLGGGRESINGSGGSTVLPTVGRNTLRLPDSANLDMRVSRSFPLGERVRLRAAAEAFNVMNHVNYSGVTQRAFLVGAAANGVTPLVFQDAATVATEGLNVLPFGSYTAAGTGQARERQLQFGLRLEF
ncbi:MAG TPA: TonB-dependent receptor [Acidobacteriaceae bacterium]|nr:TonB-dependent receptor [Acidobacteriaceae bacterium]